MGRKEARIFAAITLLLIGVLASSINIQRGEASGTIYIQADGTIKGTTYIQTDDNVTYNLTADITDSIVVQRANITVDGQGFTVHGSGTGNGIEVSPMVENVSIRNINITNFAVGTYFYESLFSAVSDCNITGNSDKGILFWLCGDNTVSGNNVIGGNVTSSFGIYLRVCLDCTVSGNNASGSNYGIYLYDAASNNTVSGNNAFGNNYGVGLSSGPSGSTFNNVVSGNNLSGNGEGIYLTGGYDNTVFGNNITGNDDGMRITGNGVNWVFGNNVTENIEGVWLSSSYENRVYENNLANNSRYGVHLDYSGFNGIYANDIANNSLVGVYFQGSGGNRVFGNNITTNAWGVGFSIGSVGNMVYHNNFVNDWMKPAEPINQTNTWDNGSVGNYWSDYLTKYPNAIQVDSSGVWNTPYQIDANNTDHYPLMQPFQPIHEVTIINLPSPTVIGGNTVEDGNLTGLGFCGNFTITIQNSGDFDEYLHVALYANSTINSTAIYARDCILNSETTVALSGMWNTSARASLSFMLYSPYTLEAVAEVTDETNTTNIDFVGNTVTLAIVGDITGSTPNLLDFVPDRTVDMKDVGTVARFFNQNVPPAPPNCDITGPTAGVPDGKVDMRDIGNVAKHFKDIYS